MKGYPISSNLSCSYVSVWQAGHGPRKRDIIFDSLIMERDREDRGVRRRWPVFVSIYFRDAWVK
jgi:hypothetical protein